MATNTCQIPLRVCRLILTDYHVSIIRDRIFSTSRAALEGKRKNLREYETGKRHNKSNSLSKLINF